MIRGCMVDKTIDFFHDFIGGYHSILLFFLAKTVDMCLVQAKMRRHTGTDQPKDNVIEVVKVFINP